ncbi:MAG: endonuclease/exonuclease/phosphatase family protein [Rikenellaceae bacterium]|nr:endonuclease/exonuclease/phosphatase family protein [Rikenellaceae bacterium]
MLIILPVLAVIFISINQYQPQRHEIIQIGQGAEGLSDTLRILTWNIGYAGLGADMDFFYEGGRDVRSSYKRSVENLSEITALLKNSDADIILLQEVDIHSKRSYYINQFDIISDIMTDYNLYFAFNFRVPFIPIPLRNPIGRVESGIAVLSKLAPELVMRHSLPQPDFKFPESYFELKRCVLSCTYKLKDGEFFTVYNIHNSAFEDDSQRMREVRYIIDSIALYGTPLFLIGGDWNQNPPGYVQSDEEKNNKYFRPGLLSPEFITQNINLYYDSGAPTARYLYEPYSVASTAVTLIDFFMVSGHFECLDVRTMDLGFENSDHNPVVITVARKK